jgi:hypothetical protein
VVISYVSEREQICVHPQKGRKGVRGGTTIASLTLALKGDRRSFSGSAVAGIGQIKSDTEGVEERFFDKPNRSQSPGD